MRADHDAAAVVDRPQNGRHEVGEALADAGSGLDQQILVLVERGLYRLGHLELLRTKLITRQGGRD